MWSPDTVRFSESIPLRVTSVGPLWGRRHTLTLNIIIITAVIITVSIKAANAGEVRTAK